jgi:tetratricopeptide (TPR) repeat protein
LRRKANDAEARGDWARALTLRREVLGHTRGDDDDKEETVEIARLHVKLKQYDEALAIVEAILDHGGRRGKGPRPAERARIEELQGDIYWRAGNPIAASDAYGGCLELGIDDGDRRRMELKTSATLSKDPVVTDLLFEYLLSERDRTHQLYIAMRLVDYDKEEPLWRYLVGLQLVNAGESESAIPWLIGPRGTISIPMIDDRRIELLAQASLAVEDWEGSRRLFTELLESPSSRARAEALEGLDRVHFALGEPLSGR